MCSINLGNLVGIPSLQRGKEENGEELLIGQSGFDFPGESRNALFA
jgi:hypothetical protein